MKRLFSPMLFMMANVPDAEKNLEMIMSMLQVTSEAVKNIKNGLDNFHATILKMSQTGPGHTTTPSAPVWPNQPPQPTAKPQPFQEPAINADPAPHIQVPVADLPLQD